MLKRTTLVLSLCFACSCSLAQQPELLILGTPHLSNPKHDMYDKTVEDILTPKRQAEIVEVVNHLASFRPTHAALECAPEQQLEFSQHYVEYRQSRYVLTSNERDQIGMRLAAKLGLASIDCVDYQNGPPGPESSYNFMTFGQAHKELKSAMDDMEAAGKRSGAQESGLSPTRPVIEWYREANQPAKLPESNRVYVQYIAPIGNAEAHPGANWIGAWHARNIIIVENLRSIAKPGDRVLALFGAGHVYLLHEFAMESGSFHVVDTESFLR